MDFQTHVILYAKHWYGHSEKGSIEDLKALLAEYSGLEMQHISDRYIMEFIIHTFIETSTSQAIDLFDALQELLCPVYKDMQRQPEQILLGKIAISPILKHFPFTLEDFTNAISGKEVKGMLKTRFAPSNEF
jgi:hypothetical protein